MGPSDDGTESRGRPDGGYQFVRKRRTTDSELARSAEHELQLNATSAPLDLAETSEASTDATAEVPTLDLIEPGAPLAPAIGGDLLSSPLRASAAESRSTVAPETRVGVPAKDAPAKAAPAIAETPTPTEDLLELAEATPTRPARDPAAFNSPREASFRAVPMPAREPWLKRRLPHLITAAILLPIASYIYGCTAVMGDGIRFRRNFSEVGTAIRNMNALGETVTPSRVEDAVRAQAAKHDMKLVRLDLFIEDIGQTEPSARGECSPLHMPDTIMRLDPIEQTNLIRAGRTCSIPNHILTLRAVVKQRWGLFSERFEHVTYVMLNDYSTGEMIDANELRQSGDDQ